MVAAQEWQSCLPVSLVLRPHCRKRGWETNCGAGRCPALSPHSCTAGLGLPWGGGGVRGPQSRKQSSDTRTQMVESLLTAAFGCVLLQRLWVVLKKPIFLYLM